MVHLHAPSSRPLALAAAAALLTAASASGQATLFTWPHEAYGKPVAYIPVPFDVYRGLDFPGADDLGNMFQFKHDFEDYFTGARNLETSRSLNPRLQTFATWLAENVDRIPAQ